MLLTCLMSAACQVRWHGRLHHPLVSDLRVLLRRSDGLDLCIPVAILHAAAFGMGYFVSKAAGFSEVVARTVSIETGGNCMHLLPLTP